MTDPEVTEPHETDFYITNIAAVSICVILAALMAGLTMGMLSLEPLELAIKMRTGTESERRMAKTLLPLINDHHRLLVTLLVINAAANEALPLFLDELVPGYVAIIMSVTLVLFFGEIIPSAIFTGPSQLRIAASFAPFVRFIQFACLPIAWPISKALDHCVGHGSGGVQMYSRKEMQALVEIQYDEGTGAMTDSHRPKKGTSIGGINRDETSMMVGALSITTQTAFAAMVPWKDIFLIGVDAVLDANTLAQIFYAGHSRIPVYRGAKEDREVLGYMMTKQLILLNPEDSVKVRNMPLHSPILCSASTNLAELLNLFQEGSKGLRGGHLALVHREEGGQGGLLGMITLEDIIEEILQEEILDESDKQERIAISRAKAVVKKWRSFAKQKGEERARDESRAGYGDIDIEDPDEMRKKLLHYGAVS